MLQSLAIRTFEDGPLQGRLKNKNVTFSFKGFFGVISKNTKTKEKFLTKI